MCSMAHAILGERTALHPVQIEEVYLEDIGGGSSDGRKKRFDSINSDVIGRWVG